MSQALFTRAGSARNAAVAGIDAVLFAVLVAVLWWWADGLIAFAAAPGGDVNRWANALCAAGTLAFGAIAYARGMSRLGAFGLGAFAGLQFFAAVLGLQRVDPELIGWLMQGDWAQHYAGWTLFRNEAWHWPLGATPGLLYPVGSSIVYTDSLPLLALPLKGLSAALPPTFQYIGAWLALSFALQGGFGALLARCRGDSPAFVLAASALFATAPVLLARIPHDTLTAHWLLLAALLAVVALPAREHPLRAAAVWWLLGALAALVHPYFVVMLGLLHLAYWAKYVVQARAVSWRWAALALGVHVALTSMLWYVSGALLVPARDAGGGQHFGHFNFNLVGLVDAMGASRWLPTLPLAGPGQYEGFSYLGLGVLVLLALLCVVRLRPRRAAAALRRHWPWLLAVIPATLLAIGSVVTFGPWTLFGSETDLPLLAAFRGSGRFIWVVYYALYVVAVFGARRFGALPAGAMLGAALLLQLADAGTVYAARAAEQRTLAQMPPDAELSDPRWEPLAYGKRHLTLAPSLFCGHAAAPYLPFQLFAAAHGMSFNGGYVARWDITAANQACRQLYADLAAGTFAADDLYVVGEDWRQFFADANRVRCENVETYTVCTASGGETPNR